MKFSDIKDWWDDTTEETKLFVTALAIFAAGFLVGAWVF